MKVCITALALSITLVGCCNNELKPPMLSSSASAQLDWGAVETPLDTALVNLPKLTPEKQKAVIIALLNNSDANCEDYMVSTIKTTNGVISGFGLGNLGLTTIAGVTAPAKSANILSNLASFATGSEKILSDTILGGNSPSIIYKSVMAVRKQERARVTELMALTNPLDAASELRAYHHKCGPIVGLNAIDDALRQAEIQAVGTGTTEAREETTDTSKSTIPQVTGTPNEATEDRSVENGAEIDAKPATVTS